jgi:hypothetical protein
MPQLGKSVTVKDWCVEVEDFKYEIDDSGVTVPTNKRVTDRFRIDDCRDVTVEDLQTGEVSITLLYREKPIVVFTRHPSDGVPNTLNGNDDLGYISDFMKNEFYKFNVRA